MSRATLRESQEAVMPGELAKELETIQPNTVPVPLVSDEKEGVLELKLLKMIGFEGRIPGGLICHPEGQHLLYALGSTVVILNISDYSQEFLRGHSNNVSCIAVNKSGNLVASGQVTYMGFKADVILWDFAKRSMLSRFCLHKVKVQDLAFSPSDKYLATLGGRDDGSIVLWNLEKLDSICGAPAAMQRAGCAYVVSFSREKDDVFFTAGDHTLRVWELDLENRKIYPTDCDLGLIKRVTRCLLPTQDNTFLLSGTTTGDVVQINTLSRVLHAYGPQKHKYPLGIEALCQLESGELLAGTGNGLIALLHGESFRKIRQAKVDGSVTSISVHAQQEKCFIGTDKCKIYIMTIDSFELELLKLSPCSAVTDVCFPVARNELFVTSSYENIQVWHTNSVVELLRITVPNLKCCAAVVQPDGKGIISGWEDGKIRAFFPESGKPVYTIQDAHSNGVTAISMTSDSKRIISGGGEGQLRVWDVSPKAQSLKESMKEHKGAVACIKVKNNGNECISASTDGTCIIWDLTRFVRNQVIFANTMFSAVSYALDECHLLTTGTDRKIAYWEVFDGTQVREMDGSKTSAINTLEVSRNSEYFVTGGDDRVIRVWKYREGELAAIGIGHSGDIAKLTYCPLQKLIVSVSADGGILIWEYPF